MDCPVRHAGPASALSLLPPVNSAPGSSMTPATARPEPADPEFLAKGLLSQTPHCGKRHRRLPLTRTSLAPGLGISRSTISEICATCIVVYWLFTALGHQHPSDFAQEKFTFSGWPEERKSHAATAPCGEVHWLRSMTERNNGRDLETVKVFTEIVWKQIACLSTSPVSGFRRNR